MSDSFTPPARSQGANALDDVTEFGVKWPKALSDALAELAVAIDFDRKAGRMAAAGRQELETEWLADKAKFEAEQAATLPPWEFHAYPVPRPDQEHLATVALAYRRRRDQAQANVNAEASDYTKLFAILDAAWRKLPSIDADRMTVAEAAAIEATNSVARKALQAANMAIGKASGWTDRDRKNMLRTYRQDPSRLPNLDRLIAISEGRTEADLTREAEAKAAKQAKAAAQKREARANAKARQGSPKVEASAEDMADIPV